jgi:hypothetical protein
MCLIEWKIKRAETIWQRGSLIKELREIIMKSQLMIIINCNLPPPSNNATLLLQQQSALYEQTIKINEN